MSVVNYAKDKTEQYAVKYGEKSIDGKINISMWGHTAHCKIIHDAVPTGTAVPMTVCGPISNLKNIWGVRLGEFGTSSKWNAGNR